MVKASNNETSQNIQIKAILSFVFKRKLPETAKVIEGSRSHIIDLSTSNFTIFRNMTSINECENDID